MTSRRDDTTLRAPAYAFDLQLFANPQVRRAVQIHANMDAIVRSRELIEHDLLVVRGDSRVAARHCRCAAKAGHSNNAAGAAREAMLAEHQLHKVDCTLAHLMRKELRLIDELRRANAALEAGAPIEAVA